MTAVLMSVMWAALALWLMSALARLQAAWEQSQRRTGELRTTLTAAGHALLANVETIQKLEDEIKRVKDKTAVTILEQKDRQELMAKSPPPPSPEIKVMSEFPPSRKDKAWVADFERDSEFPPQPWERIPMTSFVWAPDNTAALGRARQVTSEHKTYRVKSIRRF